MYVGANHGCFLPASGSASTTADGEQGLTRPYAHVDLAKSLTGGRIADSPVRSGRTTLMATLPRLPYADSPSKTPPSRRP